MNTDPAEHHALSATIDGPQTLLFDADDTLWENNIYFQRAIDGFVELVAHPSWTPAQVREEFNHIERHRTAAHGYGAKCFRASLVVALEQFQGTPCTPDQTARIDVLTAGILNAQIELLPDVAPVLAELAGRHTLLLVTKGDPVEQVAKLDASGLRAHFTHIEVLPEKHREAYLALRARHRHDAERTWMIGNSPRSDINPALAAGLNAVYLPHPNTWVLEHEALHDASTGQRLVALRTFADLLRLF